MRPTEEQLDAMEGPVAQTRRYADPRGPRVPARLDAEGGAEQHHGENNSVRDLIKRSQNTGQMPPVNASTPLHGDFTQSRDLHDVMNRVRTAQDAYADLPASVRAASLNDPVEYLAMFQDPEGREILREAGLPLPHVEGLDFEPETSHPKPPATPQPDNPEPAEPGRAPRSDPDPAGS